MPESNQYVFSHKEITEIMIKQAGLHEGRWMLLINFGFGAMNTGPTPDQAIPTAIVGVSSIGIQRAAFDSPPGMSIDAAEVNPSGAEIKSKKKRT